MPFPFTLPTTSSTSLTDHFSSSTHPSFLLTATTQRSVLRDALKKHKRLPASSQQSHLSTVNEALNAYLPYLLALNASLSNQRTAHERVEITPTTPFQSQWRPTLSRPSNPALREPDRVTLTTLSHELAFVLQTLAYVQTLHSRIALFPLYASSPPPTQDQRAAAISQAMKLLLDAQSIHSFSLSIASAPSTNINSGPVDTTPSTQSALASLSLAEATLITVLKDDPYTAAVVESRNASSKEWMISAPKIPKVRAHLYARLCLASADHAAKASGLFAQGGNKLDEGLLKYTEDLRRTARAKAARWLGIDAELASKTGEAIAWMRGARREMGFFNPSDDVESGKRKGLKGLKQSWAEKREDKKVLKGDADAWGLDAGKLEEARVVEWLEGKWGKENDTVCFRPPITAQHYCEYDANICQINVQAIPPFEPLLASMPSGREYHTPKQYTPPQLDSHTLAQMRAPPDPNTGAFKGTEVDSGDEDDASTATAQPPGAFPDTDRDYTNSPAYY